MKAELDPLDIQRHPLLQNVRYGIDNRELHAGFRSRYRGALHVSTERDQGLLLQDAMIALVDLVLVPSKAQLCRLEDFEEASKNLLITSCFALLKNFQTSVVR